jgi:hypothetical protein
MDKMVVDELQAGFDINPKQGGKDNEKESGFRIAGSRYGDFHACRLWKWKHKHKYKQ